jgi:transposase
MRNGVAYYYLVTSARVNGKPRIVEQIYLGPISRLADMAKKYAQSGIPDPESGDVKELGTVLALYDLAKRLHIDEIIDLHSGKRNQGLPVSDYIILAAINRVVESSSKNVFYDWFKRTVLYHLYPGANPKNLSSQAFWNNMELLDEKKIRDIEDEITAVIVKKHGISTDCLLFDNTNFFTYFDTSNSGELAKRGHCKSKRTDLKIVGLSLMVSPDSNIPLFHETYPGNRNDAKQFAHIIPEPERRFRKLGASHTTFTLVFDRGNNSENNIEAILDSEKGCHFVGGLRLNQCPELIEVSKTEYTALSGAKLEGVTAHRTRMELYGKEFVVVITYNPELYEAQMEGVAGNIEKCKATLSEIQNRLRKRASGEVTKGKKPTEESIEKAVTSALSAEHMKAIFDHELARDPDGHILMDFCVNDEKFQKLKDDVLGKSILFSDHLDWETEKIVSAYRSQYHVEECFKQMKDTKHLTFRPIRHYTDSNVKVHAFYCVLALMLCNVLNRELELMGYRMSVNHMIDMLNLVKEIKMTFVISDKKTVDKTSVCNYEGISKQYFEKYRLMRYLSHSKKENLV